MAKETEEQKAARIAQEWAAQVAKDEEQAAAKIREAEQKELDKRYGK